MCETTEFRFSDLPDSCTDAAFHEIKHFVTALGIEDRNTTEVFPIGSGTFIRWGDRFGILTAEHVTNFPEARRLKLDTSGNSQQILRVLIAEIPNAFGFDARTLKIFDLGPRTNDSEGPDMSVIELPQSPELDSIKARKSFWNLTHETEDRICKALDSRGCMVIAGHVGEDMRNVGDMTGFRDVIFAPGLIAFTVQERYWQLARLDYLEVGSVRTEENQAPNSYRGVSGGSLWRVRITRDAQSGEYILSEIILAGVPFVQLPEETQGHITVRGHGPITLYRELLTLLLAS